jgi:hypothetical protein
MIILHVGDIAQIKKNPDRISKGFSPYLKPFLHISINLIMYIITNTHHKNMQFFTQKFQTEVTVFESIIEFIHAPIPIKPIKARIIKRI